MSDLIAGILVIALAAERMFAEWTHAKERRYLINAAIADTPGELKLLEAKPPKRQAAPEPIDGFEGQVGI